MSPKLRRGISLLEVLISMFVLAVGLLGVAALIPAGRHEIVEAAKLDNSAMLGRAAFRDMQVRGYLDPARWRDSAAGAGSFSFDSVNAGGEFTYDGGATRSRTINVIMDPLGVAAGLPVDFPAGYTDIVAPPLRRIVPFQPASNASAVYDALFRSTFDHVIETKDSDLPAVPRWFGGATPARRMSEGNYSWMATIMSDGIAPATTKNVSVAVAVFYKRDLSGSREFWAKDVDYPGGGNTFLQELTIRDLPTDPLTNKVVLLKPGQWLMLAGSTPLTTLGTTRNIYKWLRVIAASDASGTKQQVSLAGGWPVTDARTRVFISQGVVNVLEKQMPLDLN